MHLIFFLFYRSFRRVPEVGRPRARIYPDRRSVRGGRGGGFSPLRLVSVNLLHRPDRDAHWTRSANLLAATFSPGYRPVRQAAVP